METYSSMRKVLDHQILLFMSAVLYQDFFVYLLVKKSIFKFYFMEMNFKYKFKLLINFIFHELILKVGQS